MNKTGNPVGSKAFLDFEDNVQILDQRLTSDQDTFEDRLGKSRLTWAGIERSGAGDTSIAVDAAARAVAAAGQVEQDAEQIAQDAAQQAASAVIAGVDGAVAVAESAADRAEAARDSAFVNADVYPDIAAGLAAVADGEQFQVVEGDEIVRYRRDSASTQTEVARYPSAAFSMRTATDDRRYTANGRRVDVFDLVGPAIRHQDGGASAAFAKLPGGGVRGLSGNTSQRHMLGLPYVLAPDGISEFTVEMQIDGTAASNDIGLVFGNEAADALALCWNSAGGLTIRDRESATVHFIAGGDISRSFAATDVVRLSIRRQGGLVHLEITPNDGVAQTFEIPDSVLPHEKIWLLLRGGPGVDVVFRSLVVDGVSQLALDAGDVSEHIDLFPDPALMGLSPGQFWSGSVVTEDGDIAGYFEAGELSLFSWDMSATGPLRPGSEVTYEYSRKVTSAGSSSCRNALVFYDNGGSELSRIERNNAAVSGEWENGVISGIVPAGTSKITIWAGGRNSEAWQRAPILRSNNAKLNLPVSGGGSAPGVIADRRVFVSTTGSDSNSGSESAPVQSLAAAAASDKVANGGEIILLNGDYDTSGIILTSQGQRGVITLQSRHGHRARIIRSPALTGITKTPGFTKVYQASSATSPGVWVWQHDVPDLRTLIALSERSAYQQGRECRLPSTRLRQVSSIEAIDLAEDDDPCWYWEDGTLYFSVYGGGDGTTADIRVPSSSAALTVGAGSRFQMVGVDVLYGSLTTPYADSVLLHDVRAFFTAGNAIRYDACGNFRSEYCEAAGAGNDGFNSHNTADPNYRDSVGIHLGNWAHDNYGDGHSDHACSLVQFDGGLYEYNGKAGIVPANGSHAIARNSHARNNGLITPNGGGGFAITNATSSFDTGVGTQFDLYGCVSEFNPYNFMCGPANAPGGGSGGATDANHAMRVYNGLSRSGSVAGYFAREGILTATDCRDADSSSAKLEQDGGVVAVVSTSVLA